MYVSVGGVFGKPWVVGAANLNSSPGGTLATLLIPRNGKISQKNLTYYVSEIKPQLLGRSDVHTILLFSSVSCLSFINSS